MGGDEDSLRGEKEKRAMHKQLLTTSSEQTDTQPAPEQWTPWKGKHPTPFFPYFFNMVLDIYRPYYYRVVYQQTV